MVTDLENGFHCPVSCITRKQQKIGKHTENNNISNCYYEADKRRQQEILYKQSSEAKIKYLDGNKEKTVLEFQNKLWGLGTDQEEGCVLIRQTTQTGGIDSLAPQKFKNSDTEWN